LPLIGNLVNLSFAPRSQILQRQEKFHRELGPTYAATLPFVGRLINFTDPAVLEHVLKTNFWAYEKGEFNHRTVSDLLGNGIFGVDGHVSSPVCFLFFFLRGKRMWNK